MDADRVVLGFELRHSPLYGSPTPQALERIKGERAEILGTIWNNLENGITRSKPLASILPHQRHQGLLWVCQWQETT